MRILGIDPGTRVAGYALVDKNTDTNAVTIFQAGTYNFDAKEPIGFRLANFLDRLDELIRITKPDTIGIEQPFVGKNVKSAFAIGESRGIVLVSAAKHKIPVSEYAPKLVRSTVVGHGAATKEQVKRMLEMQFPEQIGGLELDATDAIAVALCHLYLI
ncbi:MAG: crossover junction endodeoxyribonuclease RuvC [Chloroflexota bacterium]|nr:crossover junction endodeoxyribonuclease RuvC [Chloroflexota bacterium]